MTPDVTHERKGVQKMHRNRVKVTLNDDATQAIRRLSLASGESMSGVISSLFDPNIKELDRMSDLLEEAAQIRADLPESTRQFFRSVLADLKAKTEPVNEIPATPVIDPDRQKIIDDTERAMKLDNQENQAMPIHTANRSGFPSAGRLSVLELADLEESQVSLGYDCYE